MPSRKAQAPPRKSRLERPGWYLAVVKATRQLVHVHDDGDLAWPRYSDGYRGYSLEDLIFYEPIRKSWWAIGVMSKEPLYEGSLEVSALADSEGLAFRKRDQYFPDELVLRLPEDEIDRLLELHDQNCRYTEFPGRKFLQEDPPETVRVKADSGGTSRTDKKKVKDPATLLRL